MSDTTSPLNRSKTYETLRTRALDRITSARLDGDSNRDQVHQLLVELVEEYQREASLGIGGRTLRDPLDMVARLESSMLSFGPLEQFVYADDPPIEVEGRGDTVVSLDQHGRWRTCSIPTTEAELRHVMDRLLEPTGRQLTEAQPIVSTQVLGRRVRLTASIPPISDVLEFSLRFYRRLLETLDDLVAWDSLTEAAAGLCWLVMRHPRIGVEVSGPPRSGKTTMTNALLRAIPNSQTVKCVEDTRELDAPLPHISFRQTRPRTGLADDENEVTLRDLVALALRGSPDRIVVGEIRGAEAVELTRAGNAGAALLATIHANSATEALDALVDAALLGEHNMSRDAVRSAFARAVDIVIHLDSEDVELRGGDDGRPVRRQVMEIAAVPPLQGGEQAFTTIPIFQRSEIGAPLRPTGYPMPERLRHQLERVCQRYRTTLQAVIEGSEVIQQ